MIANMKAGEQEMYDRRFQNFLSKMIDVAKLQPRQKNLYAVMNSVCFRDLEVALELTLRDRPHRKLNDNG